MYVLLFALCAIALAAVIFIADTRAHVSQQAMRQLDSQAQMVAVQGAQVFFACGKQPVGVYSVASLIAAGNLPTNYPQTTAFGNAWICKVATGGVNGSNVVLVAMDGSPQQAGAFGSGALTNASVQAQVAWNVASLLVQQIGAVKNTDEGVLQANTSTLVSAQTELQYDLSGLIQTPSYSTPIVEQGLASNSTS